MTDSNRRQWLEKVGAGVLGAALSPGQQPKKTPEEIKFETQLKQIAAEIAGGKALEHIAEHIADKNLLNETIAYAAAQLEKRAAAGETIPNGPEWKYLRVTTPGKDHKEAVSIVIDPLQRTMAAYRGASVEKDGTIKISMNGRAGAYVDTRKISFNAQDSEIKGTIYGNAESGVRQLNAIQAENYKHEQQAPKPGTAVERQQQRQGADKKGGAQQP